MDKPTTRPKVPVQRANPRARPVLVRAPSPEPEISQRVSAPAAQSAQRTPASRPRRPASANESAAISGYIALRQPGEVQEFEPRTNFLNSIKDVQAMTVREPVRALVPRRTGTLAEIRGYDRDDLLCVAEMGYHYLMNGAPRIALTMFEGLQAISPREPYFCLALGLAHDHLGDRSEAFRWYQMAAQLDPQDPRADLNRAELYIESRDKKSAVHLLQRALQKAERRREGELARKAGALIRHLEATL